MLFQALDSVQKEDLVSRQLWVKENLVQWRQEVEGERRRSDRQRAASTRCTGEQGGVSLEPGSPRPFTE